MLQAVVFDMNGVIVNDERFHQEAWRRYVEKHSIKLTEDDFKHFIFGRTEKEVFEYLFKKEMTPEEVAQNSDERVDIAIELFKPHLAPTKGLIDFLQTLQTAHIKIGLATSSRKRYLNFILDGLRLRQYFQVIVTAEDITKGKPDPEIYTKTVQRLGAEPHHSIAIEDSLSGIKSAQAAGMKVVAITTTHTAEELSIANKIVGSFVDISKDDIATLTF
jgi:beta-phosphoglucomutase